MDFAGLVPLVLIIMITVIDGGSLWGHVLFIVPACISFLGIIALVLLLQSKMATQHLGQANMSLRHNIEGNSSPKKNEKGEGKRKVKKIEEKKKKKNE